MTHTPVYSKPLKHLKIIADELGMTHEGVRQVLDRSTRKIKIVYAATQADEYNRLRTRAGKMVVDSVEKALTNDAFLAELTNRLTYWMLEDRRSTKSRR